MIDFLIVSKLNTYLYYEERKNNMKKKIVNVLLSVAVITTMMFSVTACGSKTDDAQNTAADAPAATQQAADADADAKAADADADANETKAADADADANETKAADDNKDDAAEGKMTLDEWTETDECKQFIDAMNEGVEENVSIFFEVDGDVISMVYQYDEQIEVAEGAEEAMGQLFESYGSIFEQVRDEIINETGNENTVLRLEYRNADDSVIYSQDF